MIYSLATWAKHALVVFKYASFYFKIKTKINVSQVQTKFPSLGGGGPESISQMFPFFQTLNFVLDPLGFSRGGPF